MRYNLLLGWVMILVVASVCLGERPNPVFKKSTLSDQFFAEGVYHDDFNKDGISDVVAGPFWFEGPDCARRHEIFAPQVCDPKDYSNVFHIFTADFNDDTWPDVLSIGHPGTEAYWYENPAGRPGHWRRHLAVKNVGNESPLWADVDGDGLADLIYNIHGYLGYATYRPEAPELPWVFHPITSKGKYNRYTHGLGVGDINGDGRPDILEANGWWEQPIERKGDRPWIWHAFKFGEAPAQMLVYDVDGDGLNDVITAWHCHLYGLLWYQQIRDEKGQIGWKANEILSPKPDRNANDLRISQLHSLDLFDVNRDGIKDVVTGKRFWAHGPTGDVETNAPAVLYWFELRRDKQNGASFVPHKIDDDSGVGTQTTAADIDGDGFHDIVIANKKGIFVHYGAAPETQRTRSVPEPRRPEAAELLDTSVRQLFLDDSGIVSRTGLKRVIGQMKKCAENPIVVPTQACDALRCQIHGTVIYRPDLQLYQMWYLAIGNGKSLDGKPDNGATLVAYATSKDGIHWEKPKLGQVEYDGSKDNNLLKVGRINREGFAVLYNADEPDPQRRYRAWFWDHSNGRQGPNDPVEGRGLTGTPDKPMFWYANDLGDGMWTAFSPDGVHWTNYADNPVKFRHSDSGQAVVWDPKTKKYATYGRYGFGRRTGRMESKDFVHFSDPKLVFRADKEIDGRNAQVEGFSLCIYEGKYVGLPWMRFNQPAPGVEWATHVQLLVSDDGIKWNRVLPGKVFFGPGKPGEFDDGVIKLAHQPLVLDDEIRIYYCGYGLTTKCVQIGMARLRRDGWVSLDTGDSPGVVVTKPFGWTGGKIRLNADASQGEVQVTVVDASGAILAQSRPIVGDQLRALADFSGDLPSIGTPVALRITVRNARLYSWWLE